MLLEGCAWSGLDNLFIPIGGFFLLRAYLDMDTPALMLRLVVIVAIVLLVLVWRSRTTLDDSALLAGVFIGYVTWALAGRQWLVPPVIVFLAYTLLSPRTAENSRRVHDPYALLSVCAAGLAWLAAARVFDRPDFYYPYTLAFACQLGADRHGAPRVRSPEHAARDADRHLHRQSLAADPGAVRHSCGRHIDSARCRPPWASSRSRSR